MAMEMLAKLCKDALPATECKGWDILKKGYLSPDGVLMVCISGTVEDQEACTYCFQANQGQDRLRPKSTCKTHKSAYLMDSYFKEGERKRLCDNSG